MGVRFSRHAYMRMLERGISSGEVIAALKRGETIETYSRTHRWPCRLLLCEAAGRPLHVVVAEDPKARDIIVVSAYRPDLRRWHPGYRRRR